MKLKFTFIAFIAAAYHWLRRDTVAANTYDAAVETHDTTIRRTNDAAITARHLLWTQGAGANTVALATAVLPALGTIDNTETGTGVGQTVLLLGKGTTKKMVALVAIAAGAPVFQAAGGKVSTSGVLCVGYALTAAGADNDIIEVQDKNPEGPVVTPGTTTVAGGVLAIPITHRVVAKTTGGAEALTLADGAFVGQRITIFLAASSGAGTITPATKTGLTTVVLTNKGDSVTLEWTGTAGWTVVGLAGTAATGPLVTLA